MDGWMDGWTYINGYLFTQPAGYLCSVTPDETGRAVFQTVSNRIKVWDIIGRSMVIHTPKSPIPLTSR